MNKNILLLVTLLSVCSMQAQTIIDEEFNGTPEAGKLGIFSMNNYQTDVAAWDYDIDKTNFISGANSGHINVTNAGTEWWALQVRTEEFQGQKAGDVYDVSFKMASVQPTSFIFKAEGQMNFTYNVNLTGDYDVQDIRFSTGPMDSDGFVVFFFALGNSTPTEIWLDAVKITKQGGTGIENIRSNTFNTYCKDGYLNIQLKDQTNVSSVRIYDILGKEVAIVTVKDRITEIPLQKGFYVVSALDANNRPIGVSQKIVNK